MQNVHKCSIVQWNCHMLSLVGFSTFSHSSAFLTTTERHTTITKSTCRYSYIQRCRACVSVLACRRRVDCCLILLTLCHFLLLLWQLNDIMVEYTGQCLLLAFRDSLVRAYLVNAVVSCSHQMHSFTVVSLYLSECDIQLDRSSILFVIWDFWLVSSRKHCAAHFQDLDGGPCKLVESNKAASRIF